MADERAKRVAELIKPLRVKPGSKVNLGKDFDPGYKADFLKKKDGAELLKTGITLLADYQAPEGAAADPYAAAHAVVEKATSDKVGDEARRNRSRTPARAARARAART
jgi:hypothetical protein